MTTIDRFAVLLSLISVLGAALIAGLVFENMAHLEDEFAYIWQSKVIAGGDLALSSPEFPSSFLVPFVVDFQGQRFGKYPLGWPAALSLGERFGLRDWVNPILAGIAVWLNYRLGKRLFNEKIGLLASAFIVSSPLFLMHAGSLLSHLWGLVLGTAFTLFWIDTLDKDEEQWEWLKAAAAGLCLGVLGLTRPLTMIAFVIPFGIHGLGSMIRGTRRQREKIMLVGGIILCLLPLHFVWQRVLTGSFTTNPYTLWWPYDKVGFGPGYGVTELGHSLLQGWRNTKHSLRAGLGDMFGWGKLSWIFLPFGLFAARKSRGTLLFLGILISLVGLYTAYWVGSWLYGPRYYFEALPGLTILSAVGVFWLAGWPIENGLQGLNQIGLRRIRRGLIAGLTALLIFVNLYFYIPARMQGLKGLYTIERSDLLVFTSPEAHALTPALVIVHTDPWMSYGSLLELESPALDSPFIFAWSIGPRTDQALADHYRETRNVYHYYPEVEPAKLYTHPILGY